MDAKAWNGDPDAEHDPNIGHGLPYVCRECGWTARGGDKAYQHHVETGHAVRGRQWPADWPDAVFRC